MENDPHATIIPFSGLLETRIIAMNDEERKKFLETNNVQR